MAIDRTMRAGRGAPNLEATVERHGPRVLEAQRLRHRILGREMRIPWTAAARMADVDGFDRHCDHVVVRDAATDAVVATCRILPPEGARAAHGYHAEGAFDFELLGLLRERMVEVDRACIHPDYGTAAPLALFQSCLCRYLIEHGHDYVITTVMLPLLDGGHRAASIYRACADAHPSPDDLRARPRRRLPREILRDTLEVEPPDLLKAYLGLGAWICGEPAFDPELEGAVLPLLLPLARMRARDVRQFLRKAA